MPTSTVGHQPLAGIRELVAPLTPVPVDLVLTGRD
jgi:hypothetical protein